MPHATVPSPGLQAIILCGPGESLSTFTSTPRDFSKALIPIANRPMVWYPLDWCYRMGINDITLVTPEESRPGLESALATNPALTSLPSPKPTIVAPSDLTQTTGTGELLRLPEVQKAITSDFVILPCDLISELDGSKIIQQWMTLNPLSASGRHTSRKGGLGVFYPTHGLEGISQKKDETDFIATAPLASAAVPPPQGSLRSGIETVVMSMPTDTLNDKIEDDKDVFRMRAQLPHKYGRVKLRRMHRDAHVYVFPKWVKDFASQNEKFDAISEDVLGWWAKAQWQPGLGEKLGMDEALSYKSSNPNAMSESGDLEDDSIDASQLSSTKVSLPARSPASFASRVRTSKPAALSQLEVPPLLAYIQPNPKSTTPTPEQPLIRRVDTSLALLSISLYLAKQPTTHALAHEHKVHPTANVAQQSRISQEDSLVAENVRIGFRSIIKESVIGANCDIGNNVRLTRCLLMDGVTVGDGVQMTGCIIGRRAKLEGMKPAPAPAQNAEGGAEAGEKKKGKKAAFAEDEDDRTRLTDCEVAPNFQVEAGTEAKGEKMMAFDTDDLDGLELEEDEEEDESEA